jgi:hypothetical protein
MARLLRTAATSRPFAASQHLLLLAQAAETWNCRPSDLLSREKEEINAVTALQIDLAAAVALWRWRERSNPRDGVHEEHW